MKQIEWHLDSFFSRYKDIRWTENSEWFNFRFHLLEELLGTNLGVVVYSKGEVIVHLPTHTNRNNETSKSESWTSTTHSFFFLDEAEAEIKQSK